MHTVQESISKLEAKKVEVKNHCLCFRFIEKDSIFMVVLPSGYALDAVRAHFGVCSKLECLERILAALEQIWKNS